MSTSEVRKQGFLVKKVSPCSYEGTKLGFNSTMAMYSCWISVDSLEDAKSCTKCSLFTVVPKVISVELSAGNLLQLWIVVAYLKPNDCNGVSV